MSNVNNKMKAKDFTPETWELEYTDRNGNEQCLKLELSVEAVKKADDLNLVQKLTEMGTTDILSNLLYIFMIKHKGISAVSPSYAKRCAEDIIDGGEYDVKEMCATLIEEFIARYNQVFTSQGAKKTLKKA